MDLSERDATQTNGRHPWELARASFLLDVLQESGALSPAPTITRPPARQRILDVGSGDAWFAQQLLQRCQGSVTCWDLHFTNDDLERLQSPRLRAVRAAPSGPFDVALLLDVIEHVDDDEGFVADVLSRVRPGGRVLVSAPAWPLLFSAHDRALQHLRRYTPESCRRLLRRAGLHIDASGGFFHSLLLPRAATLFVEKLRAPSTDAGVGRWPHGPLLSGVITAALRAEQRLSKGAVAVGVDVPGLSFFALCTLPSEARSR